MNKIVLRNTVISVMLIVLLFFVVMLSNRSPYGKNQSSFAAVPKKEITRIELIENENRLILVRKDGNWLVNGEYEARRSAVLFILRILQEMRIKSPVSSGMFSEQIAGKGITPVKVRVYEESRVLKSFLVYKTGSNIYGNIMKMSERSRPFIVYVPGFEEEIGSFFIADRLFWQPFTLFNLLPSEISSVKVENPHDTASSFKINRKDDRYLLSGDEGWDPSAVRRYISYFTYVPFETWAADLSDDMKERIMAGDPFSIITVVRSAGEEIVLKMWQRTDDGSGARDSDRLWGKLNTGDELFIVRYFDIDPLLKKRSYFYSNNP